jgi:glycosyltransferase involved in cell wall biosynthesis
MPLSPKPLASVVVPVYNEEELLAECIESIRAQSYQNWECIIVNNCSTDASGEIARKFASLDSRIRLHQNERFVRAVPNYNGGLRQISAASKYCKIVFADDWIFPECLELMIELGEEHPSVGVVGAYGLQGRDVMWGGLPFPSRLISGREICRQLFLDGLYVFGTGTSLLFRSDIVRSRVSFYNESNLHSDSEACCEILKVWDFGFVHQVLTFTRVRENSLFEFSKELNTFAAGRLHDLVTHGPDYLTADEFRTCLERMLSDYYKVLAARVLKGYNKKFWEYHKRKLVEAGVGFDRLRLSKALFGKLMACVLNPQNTIERFLHRGRSFRAVTSKHRSSDEQKAKMIKRVSQSREITRNGVRDKQ